MMRWIDHSTKRPREATTNQVIRRTGMRDISRASAFTLLLMGAAVAPGCSAGETSAAETEANERVGRVVSVEVAVVEARGFTDYVQVVGQVRANQDVTIAAEESGPIRQLLVPKGSLVRAGQPIARIDDRLLRAQAEQAASEAALAAETYERQRRLWEEDRVGTEMAYLRARYGAQTAEAGARALRERLERTVVRAPIAGLLDDRLVEVGTMVMPGTPVARIVDVSRVKVTGGVPERFAGEIARGAVALISIDGSAAREFEGRIDFVGASVEEQGRTFPVEIVVPNPGGGLKPGMIANVRVTRGQIESALLIPQEAVLRTEDGYIVYLAVEEGDEVRAEARPVVLGPTQANQVLVTNGLTAGDRIVVVGQNKIAGGDRLQIVERGRAG
jgi:membrane fusion protein, multidrug efflux system